MHTTPKCFWKSELSAQCPVIQILCAARYSSKSGRIGLVIDNNFKSAVKMQKYHSVDYKFKHSELRNYQFKTVNSLFCTLA